MGENTKIEWARHTFNPWYGCQAVSPACDFCYAEGWAKRSGLVGWGPHAPRRRSSPANWREPLKWDAAAKAVGEKHSVFGPSLGDPFDNQVDPAWRRDYFELINATPNLIYLLLTKRPQNIIKFVTDDFGSLPQNVALGTTVEDQPRANLNVPWLLRAKDALSPLFVFLSCEPLLGPIYLRNSCPATGRFPDIDWVICGGESGSKARPMHPGWARSLREQCAAVGVPFFFKQWGDWREPTEEETYNTARGRLGNPPAFIVAEDGNVHCYRQPGIERSPVMIKVGKRAAGALLDGIEHKAFPSCLRSTAA